MKTTELKKKYERICYLIYQKRVKEALEALSDLTVVSKMGDLRVQFDNLESTYESMLKYTIEGVADPERQKIYYHLLASILELADRVQYNILYRDSDWHTFIIQAELEQQQKLTGKSIIERLDDLSFKRELDEIMDENFELGSDPTSPQSKRFKSLVITLFNHFWLTNKLTDVDLELIDLIRRIKPFRWYERCLFVSAITLSLFRHFDERKVFALFNFYEDNQQEVSQRAMIGLILSMYRYDKRLYLYPEISAKLKILQDKKGIQKEIEAIIIQIIRSRETEKISRKLREEIIPEMVKLRPKLEDKLDLDKLIPEDPGEEKNPDWKIVFEDSNDLYKKVEEFTQLQIEGADVFMTAFSQLKQFDFFREISNWFIPFYPENEVIDHSLMGEETSFDKQLFIEGLFQTSFLCNSDKYSFILNVKHMPKVQKTMMLELFNAELKGMNELAEQDEILDQFKKTKAVYQQYLQDLYRFYKLYPYKNEFEDVFSGKLDIYNSAFFNLLLTDKSTLRNIAEYLFEKEYYEEALDIYQYLNKTEKKSYEILEKIAFCYQKLGRIEEALDYYLQGELYDKNRAWNMKKIGYCYRILKQPEKALEYYLESEKLEPDNLFTQASIGHCYLDLEKFETALKYYFKVEYLDPSNKKVLRPIAWCYFVLGNLDQSKKYYNKLFKEEVSIYDYINFGHVEWCLGNPVEAINMYKKSIIHEENNLENFLMTFNDDRKFLLQNGVNQDDIPIVLDFLQYSLNQGT